MSKLLSRIAGFFSNRTFVGIDKAGNRYFTRKEEIDGITLFGFSENAGKGIDVETLKLHHLAHKQGPMKEKRWVIFKGEEDPTSVPVEWICWLNGQRKKAPTPEEMIELEARRERVRLNVALLKKEEEERRAKEGSFRKGMSSGKVGGPDLKSFIRQFPAGSEGDKLEEASDTTDGVRFSKETEAEKAVPVPASSEPEGSGASFRPGTWQPPT